MLNIPAAWLFSLLALGFSLVGTVVVIVRTPMSLSGRRDIAFVLFGVLLMLATVFPAIWLYTGLRELGAIRTVPEGYCAKCGYDLTGNTSGVCPECGAAI